MTGALITWLIVLAIIHNRKDIQRAEASAAVLIVTGVSYAVYQFDVYNSLVEAIGYYQYQSIYPLASIAILYHVKGRLALCLMLLYLALISVNAASFVYELQGAHIFEVYDFIIWVLFCVQMILLLSRKASDMACRGIFRSDTVRYFAAHYMACDTWRHSGTASAYQGEA